VVLSTEYVSMELHNKLDKLVKLSWAGRQKITYNLLEQNFDTTTTKVLLSLHKLIGDHHTTRRTTENPEYGVKNSSTTEADILPRLSHKYILALDHARHPSGDGYDRKLCHAFVSSQ
jgi:hypothetical protein